MRGGAGKPGPPCFVCAAFRRRHVQDDAVTDAPVRPAAKRLSLPTKLFYGFGTVAFGVKDQGFSYLLLIFYNQVIGMPAQMVGLVIMIAMIFDAISDPLIGQVSDNWRSRWGRRHPF